MPTIAIPSDELLHDGWLLGRLGIGKPSAHQLLDRMDPDVGSRLCFIVGLTLEYDGRVQKQVQVCQNPGKIRSSGWQILEGWPRSFREFLGKMLENSSRIKSRRAQGIGYYGNLHRMLAAETSPDLDVVRREFRDHIRLNHLISSRTRVLGENIALGDAVSLEFAADMVGCGQIMFLDILKELGLSQGIQSDIQAPSVPTQHIGLVRDFWNDSIVVTNIHEKIGCNRKAVDKLISSGLIRVMLKARSDLVNRFDVENVIRALEGPLKNAPDAESELVTASKARCIIQCSHEMIIRAIVDGKLKASARIPELSGLRGLVFEKSHFIEVGADISGRTSATHLCESFGWLSGTVRNLKRLGYLSDGLHRFVSTREIKAFLEEHASLEEMLEWENAPSTRSALRRALKAAGVAPSVSGTSKSSAFWPRRAAQRAIGALSS